MPEGYTSTEIKQVNSVAYFITDENGDNILVLRKNNGGLIKVPLSGGGSSVPGSPEDLDAAIQAALSGLIDAAPGTLNTLNELAAALGDDPNFATTITNALAAKATNAALTAETTARGNADALLIPLTQKGVASGVASLDATGKVPAGQLQDYVTQAEFGAQGPSGRELAYAESAVQQTGLSAVIDITGLSITFDVGARPVYVILDMPWVAASAAAIQVVASIADAANTDIRQGGFTVGAANQVFPLHIVERISVPGSYTRKARIKKNAGTGTVSNGSGVATTVATLTAVER